jgi:hypothetical protein
MAKARSGGGIESRVVKEKREASREKTQVRGVNPGGVDGLGQSTTKPSAATPLYGGRSFQPTPFGNEDATRGIGVGGGRRVMRSGSQGTYGAVNPGSSRPGAGKDILSDFGPEKKTGG